MRKFILFLFLLLPIFTNFIKAQTNKICVNVDHSCSTNSLKKNSTKKIKLIIHLKFNEAIRSNNDFAINSVDGKSFKIYHGSKIKRREGSFVFFTGHPEQGISLGRLDFHQPVTVAFWIKRDISSKMDSSHKKQPEYAQEYNQRKGRLLSAHGIESNKHIGSLRLGPEELEVWQASNQWGTLIPGPFPIEEWLHIAITFDEKCNATGYLNGIPQNMIQAGFDFGQNTVVFGSVSQNRYGFPFAGAIGDLRIYRGVLNEKKIATLAKTSPYQI